jgi:propionyl-CoA carboxylase alpha chain
VDLLADGVRRRYQVRCTAQQIAVNGPEGQTTFNRPGPERLGDAGAVTGECRAPLPGSVGKVLVQLGESVEVGQGLVVLEAMKMEHTLRAGGAGIVTEVRCAPGQQVETADLLVLVAAP